MNEIIIDGGDPILDCPTSYDIADKWADQANQDRCKFDAPLWSWDCGLKLDYDSPIVSISSRFYPRKHTTESNGLVAYRYMLQGAK